MQDQLNSPAIHLSMVQGVAGLPGSASMKSVVHQNGRDAVGLGLHVDDASARIVQHIYAPQLLHQGPTLMRLAL